eukprot:GEMP01091521.1.p1 GENE.GEMP01091521.1~~GEMP01091521.1.p1  ORF type:complete len:118 (+),score=24.58 GEMP01091521.1:62-415(+)
MGDSDEEAVNKDSVLPPLHIRQCELPDCLFEKVHKVVAAAMVPEDEKREKDIAALIKKSLDSDPDFNELPGKGPWQCIVGKSFASSITHDAGFVTFFDVLPYKLTVLLFKSLAVQSI